jgi:hypothetical protein
MKENNIPNLLLKEDMFSLFHLLNLEVGLTAGEGG